MSRHTPGPWSVEDDTPFSLWVRCPDGKNPLHQNRLHRDRVANARLIAAAPELLEALIGFMNEFGDKSINNKNVWNARSAIAKATGK